MLHLWGLGLGFAGVFGLEGSGGRDGGCIGGDGNGSGDGLPAGGEGIAPPLLTGSQNGVRLRGCMSGSM